MPDKIAAPTSITTKMLVSVIVLSQILLDVLSI